MRPFAISHPDSFSRVNDERWRYPVQRLFFPRAGLPKSLYLRYLRGGEEDASALAVDAARQPIARGDTLSTNTYFNSFYEAYWAEHTSLSDIALRVGFRGRLTVRVLRDVKDAGCAPILTATLAAPADPAPGIAVRHLSLEFPTRSQPFVPRGRLYFELVAEEDSEVHELAIVSAAAPVQRVRMSVGLCTFNREDFLAGTLAAISAAPGLAEVLTEVIVVNQGAPFRSAAVLEALAKDARFRVVEQRNYGGCGGFTRSIIEAQQSEAGHTHHLLMDDDIVLDNRVLETSVNFLAYARAPIALGGHMLDALRPTVVYEAGAFLRRNNRIEPYAQNADMADPDALAHFSVLVRADYNAWWFCVLPLAETRAIGYPAPIFIRGDDFEYGQRLARRGVPTVSMPGVAVWHEPFYAKPLDWQQYYDLRNRLIFAACYPEKVSIDRPLDVLGDHLLEPLLRHNYRIAALHLQAIEDFLDGPDKLLAVAPDETHDRIRTLAASYPLEHVSPAKAAALAAGEIKARPRGHLKIAAHCVRRIAALYGRPLRHAPLPVFQQKLAHSASVGNGGYVATNILGTYHIELQPDRRLLGRGLRRTLRLLARYTFRHRSAAARWRSRVDAWQTRETWEALFRHSRDGG